MDSLQDLLKVTQGALSRAQPEQGTFGSQPPVAPTKPKTHLSGLHEGCEKITYLKSFFFIFYF